MSCECLCAEAALQNHITFILSMCMVSLSYSCSLENCILPSWVTANVSCTPDGSGCLCAFGIDRSLIFFLFHQTLRWLNFHLKNLAGQFSLLWRLLQVHSDFLFGRFFLILEGYFLMFPFVDFILTNCMLS